MTTAIEVQGVCDERFAKVRDAFIQNFADHGEVGAAVAVMVDGRMVVDLWAGHMDAGRTRPWRRDTIVNVYSTTKGMTATCAHRLADQGLLDLDAPVARYWPEFAQSGKEDLPIRYLLSHQAGLPALSEVMPLGSIYDWSTMTGALARQAPWWEPGAQHGYHALTFGWLVGEVVRRITGKTLGTYFREEIAEPLGLEFHIGMDERYDSRTAETIPAPLAELQASPLAEIMSDPQSMGYKSFMVSPDLVEPDYMNSRKWRAAEIPGANGHCNARALALLYGTLARGGRLDGVSVLSADEIELARTEQANGPDAVTTLPSRIGLGFFLTRPDVPLGPNPGAFGHAGMGGSVGFADPEGGVGFGYVMNRMKVPTGSVDPRWPGLIDAVYASL